MSKCKPGATELLRSFYSKGVRLEDSQDLERSERFVVIRIPYEALLNEPDVQKAFQGLVTISSK